MNSLCVVQGYYRRADASLGMGKMKKALSDFKRAAFVAPRDPDLRKKLQQCEREVKRIRFEEALAAPVGCFLMHGLALQWCSLELCV